MSRIRWSCASLMALMALHGCSSHPCEPPRCDIRQTSCQRQVMEATACFRDADPVDVPVEVISAEEYVERRLDRADEEDRVQWEQRQRAFALLALEPNPETVGYEETVEQWVATVGALYNGDDDRVVIIDRGRVLDGEGAVSTLVHEFSHALQNRLEADEETPSTADGWTARSAMVEGDASLTDDRALLAMFGIEEGEVPWGDVFDTWQGTARDRYDAVPHKIELARRYFIYPFGLEWAYQRWREGGQRAVEATLARPPESVREVMAGPDAVAPSAGWGESLADEGKPELEPTYELLDGERWGRWVFEGFLDAVADHTTAASRLDGEHLRGDMLTLWRHAETDEPLAVWRLRFASREDAEDLVDAVDGLELEDDSFIQAYLEDGDVVLIGSGEREVGEGFEGMLSWGAVPDEADEGSGSGAARTCWLPALR